MFSAIDVDSRLAGMTRASVPRHLKGKVDPGDFAQESWVKILGESDRFAGRQTGEVSHFLRKVVVSVRNDHLRHFARGKRDSRREHSLPSGDASIASDHSTPSRRYARREMSEIVRIALASLPEDQSLAVRLHHIEGRSFAETAEIIGKSPGQVAGLVARGVKKLAEKLQALKDL